LGLSVTVGDLAQLIASGELDADVLQEIRAEYDALSAMLVEQGLGPHIEPEQLDEWPYRGQTLGFPYSSIHYLRRARAYQRAGLELVPAESDAADDPILQGEYARPLSSSHLICHADDQGFYVPKDFFTLHEAARQSIAQKAAITFG